MGKHPQNYNYAFLLVGLLLLFIVIPLSRAIPSLDIDARLRWLCLQSGFSAMMMASVWSLNLDRQTFRVGLSLMGLSIALGVIEYFLPSKTIELVVFVLVLLYCAISTFVAGRHVFSGTIVDRNMLYGAVCVYLLMGIIFALVYGMIGESWPGSFQGIERLQTQIPFDNFMYFSFVTLASLGYGDITPTVPLTRALACIEVIAGQFYIAIMVAGLVALYMKEGRDR